MERDAEDKKWMRQTSCFARGASGCIGHSKHRQVKAYTAGSLRRKEVINVDCGSWVVGQNLRYTLMQCLRMK